MYMQCKPVCSMQRFSRALKARFIPSISAWFFSAIVCVRGGEVPEPAENKYIKIIRADNRPIIHFFDCWRDFTSFGDKRQERLNFIEFAIS